MIEGTYPITFESESFQRSPPDDEVDAIDSRRKSLFAKIHGRYRTIGFADVRAISLYLIPVFSSNCRSSDSEAMNMMEIVNHAKSVLGDEFKFCAGNAHTVSRVAAGLAFAGIG